MRSDVLSSFSSESRSSDADEDDGDKVNGEEDKLVLVLVERDASSDLKRQPPLGRSA